MAFDMHNSRYKICIYFNSIIFSIFFLLTLQCSRTGELLKEPSLLQNFQKLLLFTVPNKDGTSLTLSPLLSPWVGPLTLNA